MSKCWYCNNELTSGDNPKHFGICNKCYDEMFKSGDAIVRSLTNKIAELQKQLEEKEKDIERLQGVIDKLRDKKFAGKTLVEAVNAVYEPLFKNKCDEVEEIKQQLKNQPAEIVEKIKKELGFIVNGKERIVCDGSMTGDKYIVAVLDTILKEYQK